MANCDPQACADHHYFLLVLILNFSANFVCVVMASYFLWVKSYPYFIFMFDCCLATMWMTMTTIRRLAMIWSTPIDTEPAVPERQVLAHSLHFLQLAGINFGWRPFLFKLVLSLWKYLPDWGVIAFLSQEYLYHYLYMLNSTLLNFWSVGTMFMFLSFFFLLFP